MLATTIAASSFAARADDGLITLDAYVERVLEGPEAKVLDARLKGAQAGIEGAGAWANPSASYERQSGPLNDQTNGSQDFVLLELPLSNPFRLGAEHDAAVARAEAGKYVRGGDRARLTRSAMAAFFDVVRLESRLQALRDARARLAPIVEAAQKRAAAGESAGADKLRLEVELSRLDDEIRRETNGAMVAHRHAEALSGRPLAAFDVVIALPAQPTAKTERADVRALESDILAANLEEDAGNLRLVPDASVGGGPAFLNAGSPSFEVGYAVSVRVELPVFTRGQREVARARTLRAVAETERAVLIARQNAALDVAQASAVQSRERALAFSREVLPRAETLFAASAAAVEMGSGDVLALVDAARTAKDAALDLVDAESAAQNAHADLLLVMGAFDALEDASR